MCCFLFHLAEVEAVTRGGGGEAKDNDIQVSWGRQDDATEPHPPKTRATNFWP